MPAELILAVDPGRVRWGLAVVSTDGACLVRSVVPALEGSAAVARLVDQYQPTVVAVGDRTGAREACRSLSTAGLSCCIVAVPEAGSSTEARRLYFSLNPPRGVRRLIPRGLLTPPEPIDGYAAQVIALRYIRSLNPHPSSGLT